jgi:hypothetical protein
MFHLLTYSIAFELAGVDHETKKYSMPEFEISDSSSISIKETSSDIQKSLAENGFTSAEVQASAYVM